MFGAESEEEGVVEEVGTVEEEGTSKQSGAVSKAISPFTSIVSTFWNAFAQLFQPKKAGKRDWTHIKNFGMFLGAFLVMKFGGLVFENESDYILVSEDYNWQPPEAATAQSSESPDLS